MTLARLLIPVLTLAAMASLARAQDADADRFREVEAGFEDVSPQAESTLIQPVDMRAPMGFERVYEVVGADGLYARRAGAVTAVFDRSLYAGNATPLIPAGTVFYLGSLPVDLGRPGLLSAWHGVETTGLSPLRADLSADSSGAVLVAGAVRAERVDLRVRPGEMLSGPPIADPGASIWTSESYRQRRMGELLRGVAWKVREIEAAEAQEPFEGRRR